MRMRIHENFLLDMGDGTFNVYTEQGFELIGNYPSREDAVNAFIARFGGLPIDTV